MIIENLLHDQGDVEAVRASLFRIKAVLNVAAYDYAHAALSASQEACEAALAAAPCAAVWQHMSEYQRFANKATETMDVCTTATAMLLEAEETGDPQVDRINAGVKVDALEKHVISALLEGANSRIQVAVATMPENPTPGAKCIPSKVKVVGRPNDSPEQ